MSLKAEKTLKNVASPASLITKFLVKPKDVETAKAEQKQDILKTSSPKPVDAIGKNAPPTPTPTAIKTITPRRILPTKVVSTPKEQTASPLTPSANPMSKFLIKPKDASVGKSAPVATTTAKPITPRRIQPTKVEPTSKENSISPSTSSANPMTETMTSGTTPVVDLTENAKK